MKEVGHNFVNSSWPGQTNMYGLTPASYTKAEQAPKQSRQQDGMKGLNHAQNCLAVTQHYTDGKDTAKHGLPQ